jgi:cardiolipin synthase
MMHDKGSSSFWTSFILSGIIRWKRRSNMSSGYDNKETRNRAMSKLALRKAVFHFSLVTVFGFGVLSGCAMLPNVDYLRTAQLAPAKSPTIVGARGQLSETKKQALLDAMAAKVGPTDILKKHVAAEEAISGAPLVASNKVTLLDDGPATMRAMTNAIRAARNHINLQTYIFEDDDVGRALADLLIEKKAAGVQVNLIYDSVGNIGTPVEFFERMRAGGIRALEYNPVNPLKAQRGWEINQRDHRKLLIVDGRIAFTGGVNISAVYGRSSFLNSKRKRNTPLPKNAKEAAWRDTHMQIEGPVVAEFQKIFLDTWQRQTDEALSSSSSSSSSTMQFFPPLKSEGAALVRALASTAERADYTIYKTYISALAHADKYAHLTTAYFVPDRQIVQAMKDAAQRGVDVRIIFPSFADHTMILYASRSYYDQLLAAGIKVYERNIAMLHAKTAVIDGVWSTIGSTNLDMRSFLHNDEVNAVVLNVDFAERMEDLFERDLKESTEITAEQWRRRGMGQRLREWAVRIVEYWL